MYINSVGHYIPEQIITNEHFKESSGLASEWIVSRTGVVERRKAFPDENTNTMALESVKVALSNLPYSIKDVDLIIGATYTPFDTINTLAHYVQYKFDISDCQVFTISSACSSFVNALEIVQCYFFKNKSSKALIIASEHNTAYNNDNDQKAGHLWGDGAAAFFLSNNRLTKNDFRVIDVWTKGLGNVGRSIEGITLNPKNGGIKMNHGLDIYINACSYMISSLIDLLSKNNYSKNDLDYLIPHQANIKIIKHIQQSLSISNDKLLINVDKLGNTGCASTPIVFSQNLEKFNSNDLIAFTVFGGGYSCGASLLQKE